MPVTAPPHLPDSGPLAAVDDRAGRTRALVARARNASPAVQGLAALVVYLAIWILAETYPLLAHPGRPQLDQLSTDPNFYVWSLRWWPYAVAHGLNPLHTTLIGAPAGYGLAWVTSIPPLGLLAFPVTELAGPVVTFNLLVVVAIPLSGWAAFVVCRRLTERFWASLAGGAVYGFSAYEMNHIFSGQLNLAFAMLLPLLAYLMLAWRDQVIGSRTFVALLALVMAVQFYLFIETFADMTAVLALGLAAGYLLAGQSDRKLIAGLSLRVGIAYVIAVVLAAPYMKYALSHQPAGFSSRPDTASLKLASLVIPWSSQTFGLGWLARAAAPLAGPDMDGYVSIPLLAIAVALCVVAWRRRMTRFLIVIVVLLIVLALGPTLHIAGWSAVGRLPWGRVWSLPIARSAYPVRLIVFVFLGLAVMTALWLAGPSKRWWLRWLLGLLAVAAIAANTPALALQDQSGFPAFITTGEYHQYLAPGETVVVLSERGNVGLLWQAQMDLYPRVAGGFINKAITGYDGVPGPVARLAIRGLTKQKVQRFRSYLTTAKVGAILVEQHEAGSWPAIFTRIGLHGRAVGGVIIYKT
ncbi:MAG TPA: hypothetical protein VMF87_19740 [Streptosporangiaceae bacterium]|nr:hypothetical protein [Streptosporangiaceae bacterium]